MFVVMRSEGDYSDRSEMPVFVTHTEQMAQQIVTRETERERVKFNELLSMQILKQKGYKLYMLENPTPVYKSKEENPSLEWGEERFLFQREVMHPYQDKVYAFAEQYAKDNYDSSMAEKDIGDFDIYFTYHEVPVVGENDD